MKIFKSKIVTFALALCLIVPCMFMLTACDHAHTLTKVDAVEESCTTDGNTLYYKCDCGKYFSDEEAKNEIEKDSWIVEKTGHTYASTWNYNETHHWKEATCSHSAEKGYYAEHILIDNACECGYVAITYTVASVDEWNEVFTGDYLTNGTINIADNLYVQDVIDQEQSDVTTMKSNETSMAIIMVDGTETMYQYLVNEGNVWYALSKVGDVWYGAEVSNEFVSAYTFAGNEGNFFVDRLSEFTYDEENHCYVANDLDLDGETADIVKIYIENCKLVKMEIKIYVTADSYEVLEYVFSDYGTTVIELPEWTPVPAGE